MPSREYLEGGASVGDTEQSDTHEARVQVSELGLSPRKTSVKSRFHLDSGWKCRTVEIR